MDLRRHTGGSGGGGSLPALSPLPLFLYDWHGRPNVYNGTPPGMGMASQDDPTAGDSPQRASTARVYGTVRNGDALPFPQARTFGRYRTADCPGVDGGLEYATSDTTGYVYTPYEWGVAFQLRDATKPTGLCAYDYDYYANLFAIPDEGGMRLGMTFYPSEGEDDDAQDYYLVRTDVIARLADGEPQVAWLPNRGKLTTGCWLGSLVDGEAVIEWCPFVDIIPYSTQTPEAFPPSWWDNLQDDMPFDNGYESPGDGPGVGYGYFYVYGCGNIGGWEGYWPDLTGIVSYDGIEIAQWIERAGSRSPTAELPSASDATALNLAVGTGVNHGGSFDIIIGAPFDQTVTIAYNATSNEIAAAIEAVTGVGTTTISHLDQDGAPTTGDPDDRFDQNYGTVFTWAGALEGAGPICDLDLTLLDLSDGPGLYPIGGPAPADYDYNLTEDQRKNRVLHFLPRISGDGVLADWPSLAPAAPASLAASYNGSDEPLLTWDASASGDPTSYSIKRGTTSGGETLLDTVDGDTLTFTDTTADPLTLYYYKVTATNDGGEGGPSNEVTAIVGSFDAADWGTVIDWWNPDDETHRTVVDDAFTEIASQLDSAHTLLPVTVDPIPVGDINGKVCPTFPGVTGLVADGLSVGLPCIILSVQGHLEPNGNIYTNDYGASSEDYVDFGRGPSQHLLMFDGEDEVNGWAVGNNIFRATDALDVTLCRWDDANPVMWRNGAVWGGVDRVGTGHTTVAFESGFFLANNTGAEFVSSNGPIGVVAIWSVLDEVDWPAVMALVTKEWGPFA